MLKHYIIIALRNLWKSKLFSLINIAGLAIGMAACTMILLYLQHELSFDRFHPAVDRTYRVLTIDKAIGVSSQYVGIAMPPLGPALASTLPEVETYCRISGERRVLMEVNQTHHIYADPVRDADSTFFDVFGFKLLKGDPHTALKEPFTAVITQGLAKRLYGSADPMGKTFKTANGFELTVTGLVEDPTECSHIHFESVFSMATTEQIARQQQPPNATTPIYLEVWNLIAMPTYVRLKAGASVEGFKAKLNPFIRSHNVDENFELTLQKVADVHLHSSNIVFDINSHKGDASTVYALSAVAVLILLIASVNFMNLSTARAASRAREVGMRKVVGSVRSQLVTQFLGESILLALIAMIFALSLVELFLPWLNNLSGYHIKLNIFGNGILAAGLLGLVLVVGVLAGSYPAVVLSSFQPIDVLKGSFQTSARGSLLRRVLVVVQFALSIALICGTLVVNSQLRYIHTKDLGYNRDQVLVLDLFSRPLQKSSQSLRSEIAASPHVAAVGASNAIPSRQLGRASIRLEGAPDTEKRIWSNMVVDYEFLSTLGIQLIKGRNFSRDFPSDTFNSVLINEAAAREIGAGDPLGKHLFFDTNDTTGGYVIGVVKDFHFASLRQKIEPLVVFLSEQGNPTLSIRLKAGSIPAAMSYIEGVWKKINPEHPFLYNFLDDEFDRLYRQDTNFAKIGNAFSGLAIFIACLGLFGLASHTTEQRRKEIGVRKVLGASVFSVSRLLIFDFIRWVALANILAWPIAFVVSRRWLEGFVYHTDISWIPFVVAGGIALIIAVLTVLGHAVRAATANPVNALRYE
jgi:putative ABC transport system permease protein